MSRLLLQVVNGLVGLATVALGTMQLVLGVRSPLYAAAQLPAYREMRRAAVSLPHSQLST
jgi:hypothetical protein